LAKLFCRKCGEQVFERESKCPKCENLLIPDNVIQQHSGAWFLLPFFFGIIGGIIAYFAVKEDNKREANQYLIVGIIMSIIGFIFFAIMGVFSRI